MDQTVEKYLTALRPGDPVQHKNMAVFPLFSDLPAGPEYVSMSEALRRGWLTIAEVGSGGSVPEVSAVNEGDVAVLLLDGEELAGAKQNRVLNTSILLAPKSKTVIPVSCTERGRWSQTTAVFGDSEVVAYTALRRTKMRTVTHSVRQHGTFRADQMAVWEGVARAARFLDARSPTEAMRDVFEARREEIDAYIEAVPVQTGQRGLLVWESGRVVGFDFISRPDVYQQNHRKLLRSYAMDALLHSGSEDGFSKDVALSFLKACLATSGTVHASVGLGQDHRFESDAVVGSALTYQDVSVHMAFFSTEDGLQPRSNMAGARQRAGFRRPRR